MKNLLLLISCVVWLSCDPEGREIKVVDNQSNDSLTCVLHQNIDSPSYIAPHTRFEIQNYTTILVASELHNNCKGFGYDLDIFPSNVQKQLLKADTLADNWTFVVDQENNIETCIFTVEDKDIQ